MYPSQCIFERLTVRLYVKLFWQHIEGRGATTTKRPWFSLFLGKQHHTTLVAFKGENMTLDEGFFAVCSTAFPRPVLVTLLEGLLIRGQVRRLFVHLSLRTGAVLRHAAGNKGKIYLSILLFYFARNNGTYLLNSFSI